MICELRSLRETQTQMSAMFVLRVLVQMRPLKFICILTLNNKFMYNINIETTSTGPYRSCTALLDISNPLIWCGEVWFGLILSSLGWLGLIWSGQLCLGLAMIKFALSIVRMGHTPKKT